MKLSHLQVPILIPAYQPDGKLLKLVRILKKNGVRHIVIVNDGSDSSCNSLFKSLRQLPGVHLTEHNKNYGKGRALKTGFFYILRNRSKFGKIIGCVTVDADGQHAPDDILAVAQTLHEHPRSLVLGSRTIQKMPLKSRLGNFVTMVVFKTLLGFNLSDTQTGLRAIPLRFMKECLYLSGEKYEYETNMLIATKHARIPIIEKSIQTVYINNNESSHFNPLFDSVRVYLQLIKFGISAVGASAIDYVCFFICIKITLPISLSIMLARLASGNFQYLVNKRKVFEAEGKFFLSYAKYWSLVIALGTIAYFGILFLNANFRVNIILSKVIIEAGLFVGSFLLQRNFVFSRAEAISKEGR